ncbi:MAG: ribosome small subunit-dependent GTPase A [Proteobacteria bacterium]|nr:ribosome small subunit-dependent GTPase A [Pseudomonadota bacterium]MBU1417402.1 ribosome small subunit-dependent GTPase A [Pseudomonadota bacterium]MBU1453125.1 ribosome small subunit-dependent GTPase A [Pseudomonadota bacterium]
MESSSNLNMLSNEGSFSPLNQLGWSSFFQEQLTGKSGEQPPARVSGVRKNIYLVKRGDEEIQATLAGKLFHGSDTNLPAVGDWVLLRESVITTVLFRKNALSRKASGGRSGKNGETYLGDQVIAANLDTVFIVCGLDRDFNLRRIERYLTMVYNCGIEPVVILTKADIHQNPSDFVNAVETVACGVSVYPVSANDNDAIFQLANLLPQGRTAALIGSSGAGKSTLINRLSGKEIRATGSVGTRVGKGKHITTTRDLIVLPSGGMVIDNPGIREIALTLDDEGTESAFPDIEASARLCRFKDCSHTHEPDCGVLEAVSCGEISLNRLKNYQKIKSELNYFLQRENEGAARVERERWKGVSQKIKSIRKRRN